MAMRRMSGFSGWLRRRSEHTLMAAAQADLARRYLDREGPVGSAAPPGRSAREQYFWREVFVPAYRRLPWRLRRLALHSMPGSHRRRWQWRART